MWTRLVESWEMWYDTNVCTLVFRFLSIFQSSDCMRSDKVFSRFCNFQSRGIICFQFYICGSRLVDAFLFITLMRRIVMQIVHFKWKCEFYPLFDCLPIAFSSDSLWPCLSQFFHFLSAAFCATPPPIISLILYSVHKFNNSHIPEPPIAVVRSVALLFSSFMADYHEIFCQIVLPSLIFFAVLS